MHKSKGFTLLELIITLAIIAILILAVVPMLRGAQNEAKRTKAQKDLNIIKVAIESYYKSHNNNYPATTNYQKALLGANPRILESTLNDPFAPSGTNYTYELSTRNTGTARYYVLFSVGESGKGSATVDNSGIVTVSNDAIWASNGHQ